MPDFSPYTFCLPRYSGPLARMCIRRVRMRGVFDTGSLCGRIQPTDQAGYGGTDQPQKVTEELLDDERFVCVECARRLKEVK